jgi:hypothetical protein
MEQSRSWEVNKGWLDHKFLTFYGSRRFITVLTDACWVQPYEPYFREKCVNCRSQWPRDLRRRSTAARLLRLWVRISPGHGCLSVVSVVCVQVEVSATSWWLVQRSPTECGASLCVILKLCVWGGPGPLGGLSRQKQTNVWTKEKLSFYLMQNYDKSIAGVEVGHDVFLVLPLDEYQ